MRACFSSWSATMGNCYRVPRRGGSRKDISEAYRPSSSYNKSDLAPFVSHGPVSHNAYIGGVSRRAVSSSTSLQHISEREPDGESLWMSFTRPAIQSQLEWHSVECIPPPRPLIPATVLLQKKCYVKRTQCCGICDLNCPPNHNPNVMWCGLPPNLMVFFVAHVPPSYQILWKFIK